MRLKDLKEAIRGMKPGTQKQFDLSALCPPADIPAKLARIALELGRSNGIAFVSEVNNKFVTIKRWR